MRKTVSQDGNAISENGVTMTIGITPSQSTNEDSYRVAIWVFTGANANATVSATDASDLPQTATVNTCTNGEWLVWTLRGDASIKVKSGAGDVAVGGIYFDTPDLERYLTKVSTGLAGGTLSTTLSAAYSPQGKLTALTDAMDNSASVSGGVASAQGSQTVTVPTDSGSDSQATQTIYDSHGGVARTIQSVYENGSLTGYLVTVTDNQYMAVNLNGADLTDVFQSQATGVAPPGFSTQNALMSTTTYAPFLVPATDANAVTDALNLAPVTAVSETLYNAAASGSETAGQFDPSERIEYLPDGEAQATVYRYSVELGGTTLSSVDGRPVETQVSINPVDSDGFLGTGSFVSTQYMQYDSSGNLKLSVDIPSPDPVLGTGTGVTTWYTYTSGSTYTYVLNPALPGGYGGIPSGLPLETYQTSAAGTQALSSDVYYTTTSAPQGEFAGMLESSTDASGRTTYYAYTADGQTAITYYEADGLWVVSASEYNGDDQVTGTETASYDAAENGALDFTIGSGFPAFTNTLVGTAVTTSTAYDPQGRVQTSTDQYGGITYDFYDADGNTIQTTDPNGDVVQSVYDDQGRVIWQTDSFKPSGDRHGREISRKSLVT